jgi:hypothetical protein
MRFSLVLGFGSRWQRNLPSVHSAKSCGRNFPYPQADALRGRGRARAGQPDRANVREEKPGAAFWMKVPRSDVETAAGVLAAQIRKIASYEDRKDPRPHRAVHAASPG